MSARMNRVELLGRIGKNPDVNSLQNGSIVVNFSLATDESFRDKEGTLVPRTEWHRIVAFDHQADFVVKYLGKGRLVLIEGKLRTRSYQKDGQTRYVTEIVAHRIQALDRAKDEQGDVDPVDQEVSVPETPESMDEVPF